MASEDQVALSAVLAEWRNWNAALRQEPRVLRRLAGFTNQSYLVGDGGVKLVVRIDATDSVLRIDRQRERQILRDIAPRPFALPVLHSGNNYLVSRYVAGAPVSRDTFGIDQSAHLLRLIHQTPTQISARMNLAAAVNDWTRSIADERIGRMAEAILARQQVDCDVTCLCHNDLSPENILVSESGPVVLDWEYAAPGDPAFDIAGHIETMSLNRDETARLLDAYGDPVVAERVPESRLLFLLITSLWWHRQDPARTRWSELEQRLR